MGTSIANSNAIPFNKSHIRNSVMKSLILWYDIAKQQATNESMAATPMLRDLSGNGHDATCYNFAWSGMSGIVTDDAGLCLLSDGVDDYAKATGLPILTKEKGYTVFAKAEILRKWGTQDVASKVRDNGISQGAFDLMSGNGSTFSFGKYSSVTYPDSGIFWQTSKSYCGQDIDMGAATDLDFLLLGKKTDTSSSVSQMKLYCFILFDRDLTDNEIEWVKKNMIEGGGGSYEI